MFITKARYRSKLDGISFHKRALAAVLAVDIRRAKILNKIII